MRHPLTVALLLAAFPAAAMDGAEFLRLCERDANPCAGIIREQLKDWPERVLDPARLKAGTLEYMTCPPHLEAQSLADLFVRQVTEKGIRLQGLSMEDAIDAVFARNFPDCASGTSG